MSTLPPKPLWLCTPAPETCSDFTLPEPGASQEPEDRDRPCLGHRAGPEEDTGQPWGHWVTSGGPAAREPVHPRGRQLSPKGSLLAQDTPAQMDF